LKKKKGEEGTGGREGRSLQCALTILPMREKNEGGEEEDAFYLGDISEKSGKRKERRMMTF